MVQLGIYKNNHLLLWLRLAFSHVMGWVVIKIWLDEKFPCLVLQCSWSHSALFPSVVHKEQVRGCSVLRECWYLLVDGLKILEKSGEIYTPKPFSGLRGFKWLLLLLGHHFKQYLRCVCWFLYSDLGPATVLAHPGEIGLVRNSHKLQPVKLRHRGEVPVPRPCRKSVLESRAVMVPGPVHNQGSH